MKNFYRLLILLIASILTLTGCGTSASTEVKDDTISIIYNAETMNSTMLTFVESKAREYTQETGVSVNFEPINGLSQEDFNTKLDVKLTMQDGPSILFVTRQNSEYWKVKPFHNITKLSNYNNIISTLKSDIFVPFTFYISTLDINRHIAERYGYDSETLTTEDFIELKKAYRNDNPTTMDAMHFFELHRHYFDKHSLIDEDGNLDIINDDILETIEAFKADVTSERYSTPKFNELDDILEFFNQDSFQKAYKKRVSNEREYLLGPPSNRIFNALNLKAYRDYTSDPTFVTIPSYYTQSEIRYYGFLINPNGHNINQSEDFIDRFLSKDCQQEIFEKGGAHYLNIDFAPVVTNIEDSKDEYYTKNVIDQGLIDKSKTTYNNLSSGKYTIYYNNPPYGDIRHLMYNVILEYVFTDKYSSSDELVEVLEANEEKVNFFK